MSEQRQTLVLYSRKRQKMSSLQTYATIFANIWKHRWFIWILFARDYFMANKRTFLGYGWLLLAPLLSSMSWVALNLLGVLNTGEISVPFPLFVLIGTSFWTLFFNTYANNVDLFSIASGMLGSVSFPHETLIIAQTMKALANFFISSVLNFTILIIFGVYPTFAWLLLPFMLMPLIFLAGGFGLLLMVVKHALPDLERVFAFFLPMLMYITPIVFLPTQKSEKFFFLIKYNPLTYLIGVPRDIVLFGHSDFWGFYGWASVASALFFLLMVRVFYIAEEYLIEKLY
ncbi:ABC transporter permease [Entomospira culicis]|uniref:Transport permease protein n=1 Tax=Entomospira culicis TaxID=2719989 RepID=A0A968GK04_9SPIO|nr:hypothetical protein [Entomospira culicis]NIZ19933.1 hypothetical protein [Entomospira culicis]NIZ70110.1 hypothetical protein [Entomospira culicis]WDI38037.1 hypothetical protein PVA46_07815 [Entomospira culicis]WDI39660.1 hypothetical protein PVA47_07815 [Entomospira culicis]